MVQFMNLLRNVICLIVIVVDEKNVGALCHKFVPATFENSFCLYKLVNSVWEKTYTMTHFENFCTSNNLWSNDLLVIGVQMILVS